MAVYAELISSLPLYRELDRTAGRDAILATDVDVLKGLVIDVADTIGPCLARIPVMFRQYTVHDIHHCRNVIERMGDIIPPETRENLNALEITLLLLSALLHDVGMAITDEEKEEALGSAAFQRFRSEGHTDRNKAIEDARAAGHELRARAIEDALLAEYFRRLHPERVKLFMDRDLTDRLRFRDIDLAEDLGRLCESHGWGIDHSNDARHPEKAVSLLDDNVRLYGVRVNLQYLACILRLADILDFDRSRTPLAVFQHLDFSEPKSWEEWNKHLQVKGYEITSTQVAFEISCTHPVFYVSIHEFLGWIDDELRQCRYLIENKQQATADRYKLYLPHVVDRRKVRMKDPTYLACAFRFQLEYENILTLLMDKSLYPDPSLFLRELLQNALDACRRKEAHMEVGDLKMIYTPKIVVWDRTDDPEDPRVVFLDNGIGMSQRIVEHYFLRIGRSYYRSPEFDTERQRLREHGKELDASSQFGIGILSCFLVGDHFEVETFQEGYTPLHILIEGPTKYFVIKQLPQPQQSLLYRPPSSDEYAGPPHRTGTRVTVHFRPGVGVNVWQTLDTFAANADFPIAVYSSDWEGPRIIDALRWEVTARVDGHLLSTPRDNNLLALKDALIASEIPFSRWTFSSHLRGRAWFWLLQDPTGRTTPKLGFLEIGTELRLTGIPKIVEQLDSIHRALERKFPYREWSTRLRNRSRSRCEGDWQDSLVDQWLDLSEDDKNKLDKVIEARSRVLDRTDKLKHWTKHPGIIELFLGGSIEWAEQPVGFSTEVEGPTVVLKNSEQEELLAIQSILVPGGIVGSSPLEAAKRIDLRAWFGGARIDVRSAQAPRPAAHRLFVPIEEAKHFRQQYLHAALLHGVDLVRQHGRTLDWRRWFCEIANNATHLGLDPLAFARESGQLVEEIFGLAVRLSEGIVYLSRAEVANLIPGPIFLIENRESTQGILLRDPINRLLCDPDAWKVYAEVDLSVLPIRRAE